MISYNSKTVFRSLGTTAEDHFSLSTVCLTEGEIDEVIIPIAP